MKKDMDLNELVEYIDSHLMLALWGAETLHGARDLSEDYVRDRLVAISDTFDTHEVLEAENDRRTFSRLRTLIQDSRRSQEAS